MGLHLQRALSSVWLALLIWFIYSGQWSVNVELLLAVGVYLAGIAIRYAFLRRKSGGKKSQDATKWRLSAGTVFWTIVFAIAQFLLVSLTFFIFHIVADLTAYSRLYWFPLIVFLLLAIWLVLTLTGIILMMAELVKGAERQQTALKLFEVPLAAFKLFKQRGASMLGRSTVALLFVWLAFLPIGTQPFGSSIGFLILLLSMDWLQFVPQAVEATHEARPAALKGMKRMGLAGLVLVVVFLLFYAFLFSYFPGPSIAFLGGLLSGGVIYFIGWGIVKLRLFIVLKWLMALLIYPVFAAWVFWMWFVSQ